MVAPELGESFEVTIFIGTVALNRFYASIINIKRFNAFDECF